MCQKSDTICIKQHRLDITIDPGVRMWITDTLLVDVDDPLGFWATLNSKAKVTKVLLQGEEIDFTFRGGLLSVNQTDIRNGELVINYSLSREADLLASKFGESLNSYFGAVQSTLLKGDYQQTYGDSTVRVFWRTRRESYLSNSDGKTALWSDSYGSIFYNKGPWVLKILRDQLGEKTFEAGFKNYIQNTLTPDKDIYAFAKSMSAAAGFDVWPMLETWLKSKAHSGSEGVGPRRTFGDRTDGR